MIISNKEQIRDRMIKTAAKYWGVQENEIGSSFDPLIILMIGACAAELEKIGYDISGMHSRLLDRLVDLILPEVMTGPKPASCIVQAFPTVPSTTIHPLNNFYINKSISENTQNIEIHFSPIGNFTLHKADVSYLFSGSKLYKINESNNREIVFNNDAKVYSDEVWLAIACEKELKTLKGLQLFFNLHSHSKSKTFYNSLQMSHAWLNGQPIELGKKYYNNDQFELNPNEMLASGTDYTKKAARQTAFIYSDRFVHFNDDVELSQLAIPIEWEQLLPHDLIGKIKEEELCFLKLKLDQHFEQDVFDALHCNINAFPVVNLKLNTLDHRTDNWVNIIPLPAEDLFFDLHAIKGSDGSQYKYRTSAGKHSLEVGEAIITNSGIGKTSSHEVKELTSILAEAIRDQSAYFTNVSNDFILSRLKEINQILSSLEDHLSTAKESKSVRQYILLRPKREGEFITIDYWTTNGVEAHHIKSGNILFSSNDSFINSSKILTLTSSVGGMDGATEIQKRTMLRQQLVSGGKIISAEDVKLLCRQLFGDRLQKVEVRKGVQISKNKAEGFQRSIDVAITYSNEVSNGIKGEVSELRRQLEYILYTNGSPVYPFRIIVENDFE